MIKKKILDKIFFYLYSLGFSRDNHYALDTSKGEVLYQFFNPISVKYDSRVILTVKKKRELFPG